MSRRAELMGLIRNYKPLVTSVSRVRILMIGPVGAGKSSFFNSINSIFMGRITSKAMSGSAGTSLTTQVQEVSSWLGVPVSCVLPLKNYNQELELNCDVLLLTALQQMLNFADDYLDDAG